MQGVAAGGQREGAVGEGQRVEVGQGKADVLDADLAAQAQRFVDRVFAVVDGEHAGDGAGQREGHGADRGADVDDAVADGRGRQLDGQLDRGIALDAGPPWTPVAHVALRLSAVVDREDRARGREADDDIVPLDPHGLASTIGARRRARARWPGSRS